MATEPPRCDDYVMGIKKSLLIAAVGAGTALLLAPRSGKQTRQRLAEKARTLKKSTTKAYKEGKDTLARAGNTLKGDVKSIAKTRKRPAVRKSTTRSRKAR